MLDSLVRVSRRVGWVTDLLAANHDSASAGELPRSQRLLAGQPAAAGPTRTAGDDKLAQRVLRSVSGGRHRSGLPTTGRSPWGLDGVTNFSCTAREESDTSTALSLQALSDSSPAAVFDGAVTSVLSVAPFRSSSDTAVAAVSPSSGSRRVLLRSTCCP
ncbi:hypothetical protein MTO96_031486 [Rhipicephalus appendiculatus]